MHKIRYKTCRNKMLICSCGVPSKSCSRVTRWHACHRFAIPAIVCRVGAKSTNDEFSPPACYFISPYIQIFFSVSTSFSDALDLRGIFFPLMSETSFQIHTEQRVIIYFCIFLCSQIRVVKRHNVITRNNYYFDP
jgi:hypothetical protein